MPCPRIRSWQLCQKHWQISIAAVDRPWLSDETRSQESLCEATTSRQSPHPRGSGSRGYLPNRCPSPSLVAMFPELAPPSSTLPAHSIVQQSCRAQRFPQEQERAIVRVSPAGGSPALTSMRPVQRLMLQGLDGGCRLGFMLRSAQKPSNDRALRRARVAKPSVQQDALTISVERVHERLAKGGEPSGDVLRQEAARAISLTQSRVR